jgi:hypothetical protein
MTAFISCAMAGGNSYFKRILSVFGLFSSSLKRREVGIRVDADWASPPPPPPPPPPPILLITDDDESGLTMLSPCSREKGISLGFFSKGMLCMSTLFSIIGEHFGTCLQEDQRFNK